MGFMDKIKGKLSSSSSSSGSGENKRASFAGSSPQAAAAPSSTQTPAAATAANPATSATAAAPAATTTTAAAATTAPATTAPATTATTTTPATAASNPATTAGNDTSYQPEPATEANKSTGATTTTSSTNMTSYTGTCHCKHHEWTVELTPDQSKHILWYVPSLFNKQSHISFSSPPQKRKPIKLTSPNLNSHCDTCKILGGGAYTMNQIIPKSALKITKGGEPGKYTYYGDSGKVHPPYIPPTPPFSPLSNTFFYRQSTATTAPNVPLTSTIIKKSWAPKPLLLERHFCEMHEKHLALGRKFMGRRK